MGYEKKVYLGVYVKVPIVDKGVEQIVYIKPDGKKSKTRFNPDSGEEYKSEKVITYEKIYPTSYITDNDSLCEDEFYTCELNDKKNAIFLLNYGKFHIDDDIEHRELYDSRESELEKFCSTYKNYIEYYQNKYENVQVCYGIVNYYC